MNISKGGLLYKYLSIFCCNRDMPKTNCQLFWALFFLAFVLPAILIALACGSFMAAYDFNVWLGLPSFLAGFLAPQTLAILCLTAYLACNGLDRFFEYCSEYSIRNSAKEEKPSKNCSLINYVD